MIDFGVNGIVLRSKNGTLGDVGNLQACGKSLADWVAASINASTAFVDFSSAINMCDKLKESIDRKKPITVVLYCDTPLVSARTITSTIEKLQNNGLSVLKLPRGFVFKTEYLFETESLFLQSDEPTEGEFFTVTDGEGLSMASDVIRKRILRYHSLSGVSIIDFNNTYIDCDVVISRGVVIEPYNFIKGKTLIKENAYILPGNYIENCIIAENARIDSSRLYNSSIGKNTTVGPFAYFRPNSVVGDNCRIGDFVELKNCVIGNGSKVCHLSYVGDAQLGEECNVGCGVVFANYDGKNKYRSIIGNRVFIGSNANIVAPVCVEDRAFIAAGSTITKTVPKQALAIARARQSLVENWQGNAYAPPINDGTNTANNSYAVQYGDGVIDVSSRIKK